MPSSYSRILNDSTSVSLKWKLFLNLLVFLYIFFFSEMLLDKFNHTFCLSVKRYDLQSYYLYIHMYIYFRVFVWIAYLIALNRTSACKHITSRLQHLCTSHRIMRNTIKENWSIAFIWLSLLFFFLVELPRWTI